MSTKAKRTNATATQAPTEGYLLKGEVAARLRKTPATVEIWMRQGIIPYVKLGRGRRATVLFKWPEIEASLKARFGHGGSN